MTYEYTGVVHCHSDHSDGRASLDEILREANRARLDYLILTDHNTMAAKNDYPTGRYGQVLLLHGVEITPRYNHYLALGVEDFPDENQDAQTIIDRVQESGGTGFICHPHDRGSSFLFHPSYEWRDWKVKGMNGVEIWSFMSQWVAYCQGPLRTLRGLLQPGRVFLGPPRETLDWWDRECQLQKTVGIGAVDAHALRTWIMGIPWTILSLRPAFSSIRTNVVSEKPLAEDPAEAAAQIVHALAAGHVYTADYSGSFQGGLTFVGEQDGRALTMGDEARLESPVTLSAVWPHPGILKVICNGTLSETITGTSWEKKVEIPGVYRLEVWPPQGGKPWALSNPIYLRSDTQNGGPEPNTERRNGHEV